MLCWNFKKRGKEERCSDGTQNPICLLKGIKLYTYHRWVLWYINLNFNKPEERNNWEWENIEKKFWQYTGNCWILITDNRSSSYCYAFVYAWTSSRCFSKISTCMSLFIQCNIGMVLFAYLLRVQSTFPLISV